MHLTKQGMVFKKMSRDKMSDENILVLLRLIYQECLPFLEMINIIDWITQRFTQLICTQKIDYE